MLSKGDAQKVAFEWASLIFFCSVNILPYIEQELFTVFCNVPPFGYKSFSNAGKCYFYD